MIFRFVILPMFLFSGTFFPISRLPAAFEAIAYATPLWHGVDLCRQLMLGDIVLSTAFGHVLFLVAWIVVCVTIALIAYRRRLLL
jgi:lipooligosaccharide transport system permease protein